MSPDLQIRLLGELRLTYPQATGSSQVTTVNIVRVWLEDQGEGRTEWRGKVQHTTSGEARYFRDWSMLIAHMQEMLGGSPEAAQGQ